MFFFFVSQSLSEVFAFQGATADLDAFEPGLMSSPFLSDTKRDRGSTPLISLMSLRSKGQSEVIQKIWWIIEL